MIAPVLNERSLESCQVPTNDRISSLISVLRRFDGLGFQRALRHTRAALEGEVEPGISLRAWLFQRAPREVRQFIGGRLSRAPFVEDLLLTQEEQRGALLHVSYDGDPAPGAGVAYLLDTAAVALRGVPRWEADPLVLLLSAMDGEDGTFVETSVEVVNVCRPEQIDAREKALRARVLRDVGTGDELWQRRAEMFPRLDFCEGVERQLRDLAGSEPAFHHVIQALARLDSALAEWSSGPLYPGMSSSVDSEATLKHGVYGPMRDFVCPDGMVRRFSNHLKLFSCNWRIYYAESRSGEAGGRALIGYIGAHLPTVRYRT